MKNQTTDAIVERLHRLHPKVIDLSLGRINTLLEKLGNPQDRLPPVIHVAGTNGKGSTIAFMRAFCEEAGLKVHVYTSPHLVHFAERIRIAGKLPEESEIIELLEEVEAANGDSPITFFEVTTAAAFLAFSRNYADVLLLETGLGGRLDATNVVKKPAATVITPISVDHQSYLGDTIEEIAGEKVGIIKENVPCFSSEQENNVKKILLNITKEKNSPFFIENSDWNAVFDGKNIKYSGLNEKILPKPALNGFHQVNNASLALSVIENLVKNGVLRSGKFDKAFEKGMSSVSWAGRMQPVKEGFFASMLPKDWELYIDGGHNPSAGEVLRQEINNWQGITLHVIAGMMATKDSGLFLKKLSGCAASFHTVGISGFNSRTAEELYEIALTAGIENVKASESVEEAIKDIISGNEKPARILICGSLYLIGTVLKQNTA